MQSKNLITPTSAFPGVKQRLGWKPLAPSPVAMIRLAQCPCSATEGWRSRTSVPRTSINQQQLKGFVTLASCHLAVGGEGYTNTPALGLVVRSLAGAGAAKGYVNCLTSLGSRRGFGHQAAEGKFNSLTRLP